MRAGYDGLARLLDVAGRVARRGAAAILVVKLLEPVELGADLLDGEAEHPDRLMEWMADLAEDVLLGALLAGKLAGEKLAAGAELAGEDPGARLPGERKPGEEWGAVELGGPIETLEGVGESVAAGGSGCEDATLGAVIAGSLRVKGVDKAKPGELVERVIDLRPGDAGPVADLAELKQGVGLITVHGLLGQEAEEDEVGGGQFFA